MLVEQIDHSRDNCNLSSAIRTFVFNHFRAREKMGSAASSATVQDKNAMQLSENRQLPGSGSYLSICAGFRWHQRVYLSRWAPVQTFGH